MNSLFDNLKDKTEIRVFLTRTDQGEAHGRYRERKSDGPILFLDDADGKEVRVAKCFIAMVLTV